MKKILKLLFFVLLIGIIIGGFTADNYIFGFLSALFSIVVLISYFVYKSVVKDMETEKTNSYNDYKSVNNEIESEEEVKAYDDYKEVPENSIYKFKKDNHNVIRFKKEVPEGFTRWQNIGLTGEKVVGTSYRQEECKKFVNGENRSVDVRYSTNEKYPNAIEVLGIWEDSEGKNKEQIGNIEKEIAEEINNTYENLPIDANLATIYKPTKNKNLGIRIFLLRKKRPSKYKK